MPRNSILAAPVTGLALILGACSSPPLTQADRPILVAKCEDAAKSTIKGITADQSAAMCGCTADKLIAEKMTALAMFSAKGRETMATCAKEAGVGKKKAEGAATPEG